MKHTVISLFLLATFAAAQHQHGANAKAAVEMFTGLGNTHHPVTTKNAQAQKYFDQGLALLYGFNHEEAAKSFQQAATLDPDLAMAYWGVAIVNGLNYNAPEFPDALKVARENVKKAQAVASKASPSEQAYIAALAKRYEDDPKLDAAMREVAYSEAMRGVMESNPDDLDAATLYAESVMNQSPWQLWSKDGTPGRYTERVVEILESVLRRNPNHLGANHYYIHAVEASPDPYRALRAADRLRDLKLSAGHLVHMPAHIYLRTGDYILAGDENVQAADADRAYLARSTNKPGLYAMMYFSHNMHFEALSDAMAGRYASARKAADAVSAHVSPAVKEMGMLEGFVPIPTYVMVRFHKWDEILKLPEPDKSLLLCHAIWHWARGMAHASKGGFVAADHEYGALAEEKARVPETAMVDKNHLSSVLQIASDMLGARIAQGRKDYPAAKQLYEDAAKIHDNFNYIEPPEWPFPVREALGGMYLASGKPAEAEKAFREDLERNPRSGRSLFGLMQALKAQGKNDAAALVELEFKAAWKMADTELKVGEL